MLSFKNFIKTVPKDKLPAMETVFGTHSKPKDKLPAMETQFGEHSLPKKELKESEVHDSERTTAEHSHVHEHVAPYHSDKVSVDERNSVYSYTRNSKELNGALHKHYANRPVDDYDKEEIHNISSALKKHKTKEDTHVYTGIPYSPSKHFTDPKKSATVHLPAFTSTSTSRKTASSYANFENHKNDKNHGVVHSKEDKVAGHILKIHVPKGTHAMSVKKQSAHDHENEILLDRGHHIEIHPKPEHIGNNVHVWHAKIVKHEPKPLHDEE